MAHTPNMRLFVRRLCIALCLLLPPTALSQMLATSDKMVVVSVGTRTRQELQDTQKQTFAKHLETWYYDEVDSLLQQQLMSVARALLGFLTVCLLSPNFLQRSALPPSPAVLLQGVAPCVFIRPTALQLARFQSCDHAHKPFPYEVKGLGWCALSLVLPGIACQVQVAQMCNVVTSLADTRRASDAFRWCATRRVHQAIAAALQQLTQSPASLPEWMVVS